MLGGRGCVVFTATDPAGPWSDGTPIAGVDGIDPDLAWDDDGTAYVTFAGFPHADPAGAGRPGHRRRRSRRRGRCGRAPACTPPRARTSTAAATHWYLLVAEGGTDRGHAVSVARGPSPEGPWESHPANPVLTATGTDNAGAEPRARRPGRDPGRRHRHGAARRAAGRLRPSFSPLGRETFLAPVRWVDGWPQADLVDPTGDPRRGRASTSPTPACSTTRAGSPSAARPPRWRGRATAGW